MVDDRLRRLKSAVRWFVCLVVPVGCVLLAIYEVREFRRAAEPIEKLSGRLVRAAGGDVGEILGRRAIQRLDLSGGRIDDKALAELVPELERLGWLDRLSLAGARVSAPGFAALESLRQLRSLDLQNTSIDDESLEKLQSLAQLESLDLTGTAIGDRGVAELAGLTNLRVLWLDGTKITDDSIDDLIRHEQLEIVGLADTGVTAQGIERLERALPDCIVIFRAQE
jgi:hypothetical protein